MISGRERIQQAMALQRPDGIPVMSQLSIGHLLLQTGMDPVEFNLTNTGFAEALLEMRARYDFDGILIHKPGREEKVLEIIRREDEEDVIRLIFPDGGEISCPFDDDPRYSPPPGYRLPTVSDFDADSLFVDVPASMQYWWGHCGLLELSALTDVPDFWYACIDLVKNAVQDRYSVHGEVNSPFDAIFHLLDFEDVLVGLLTYPYVIHEVLDVLSGFSSIWAVAQVRRGCDAIKLSSPWAGSAFISRKHYETFVLPYERRIVQAVRAEGGVIYTHTCGAIADRLDLMIASGVHGIECLDPPPLGDVELDRVVAEWGERIFIKGNVDPVNTLLRKSPQAVNIDASRRVAIGARGSGFILSSACSIAPRVPAENVRAMVRAARNS